MNGSPSSGGKVLISAASFVIVVSGLKAASAIVVPFLLAAFIAIVCGPLLFFLQRRRIPTPLAVLLVVGVILAGALTVGAFVGNSLTEFLSEIPTFKQLLRAEAVEAVHWLQARGVEIADDVFFEYFDPGMAIGMVGQGLSSITGVLANAFMILLTVVFILLEASTMPAKVRAVVPDPETRLSRYAQFLESVNKYLAIKSVISLVTGVTIAVWLSVLRIDYALLWGLVAFLFNYVPSIGSIIAALPAMMVALIQYGPGKTLAVAAGYMVVNIVFGNFLEPRVMGRGLGLSPLVVFLSLVFWGWVLGPVGMLLSVPLTMIVKLGLESNEDTRWIAILLGSERTIPPPDPSGGR